MWTNEVVLVSALFLTLICKGLAVRCYICSWAPNDGNRGNRTDHCTEDNFDPMATVTHDCNRGCKFYIQKDLNGEVEHVRRTCADTDPLKPGCKPETTIAWVRKQCFCNYDYCNQATAATACSALLALLSILWPLKEFISL